MNCSRNLKLLASELSFLIKHVKNYLPGSYFRDWRVLDGNFSSSLPCLEIKGNSATRKQPSVQPALRGLFLRTNSFKPLVTRLHNVYATVFSKLFLLLAQTDCAWGNKDKELLMKVWIAYWHNLFQASRYRHRAVVRRNRAIKLSTGQTSVIHPRRLLSCASVG